MPLSPNKLMELTLRVLFNTAKPAEVAAIRSLKRTNPTQWKTFLWYRFVLQGIDKAATGKNQCN